MKIQKLRMIWRNRADSYKGILMYDESSEDFIQAKFGDGTNLDNEDYDNGYNDYIYITIFETGKYFDDATEIDGGMLMFNNKDTEYYNDLDLFIDDVCQLMDRERCNMNLIRII